MRRRFFVDRFVHHSAAIHGETAEHLGRVLRAEPGQLYELSDGTAVWLAQVERVELPKRGESRIEFTLVEPVAARETLLQITLLLSVIKFDRFEWCLEKAVELGAAEIVPVAAARTDKPLIAAAEKRRARWDKILVESSQQARRLRPPLLRMCPETGRVLGSRDAFEQSSADWKFLLSERREAAPIREALPERESREQERKKRLSVSLAIGPEGGWTDEELTSARAAGFAEVSLGENILRTETAVISAMAILRFALG
jgi:16S rRNA (uracil1498-N3)-methyltransferase